MNLSYSDIINKAHYHNREKIILTKVIRDLKNNGAKSLLDVGCGIGEYVRLLKISELDFDGVDSSEEMIRIANINGHNAFLIDVLKESDKKYDIILISHVIEHIPYKELIEFMHLYINKLNQNGRIILLSPLLVENFYYDFTHERPYYPQAIWQMFGDYSNSLSVGKKALILLEDIYFVRDSFRTRTWRSYYIKENEITFILTKLYNYILALMYLVSFAKVGKKVSWIGIYKKNK